VLVYRVFPYLDTAAPGEPGHPLYEHRPQRGGRIDHPDYHVWYVARAQEAAVGETFGNVGRWRASMFDVPLIAGSRRALGIFRLSDTLRVLDLDDPRELLQRALRPTHVVARNLAVTQRWGHDIWSEPDPHDDNTRRWEAVQWWSYHEATWVVIASWARPSLERVERLDLDHPAVVEAASTLLRPMR
jgi:hypothetical protein